MKKLIIICLSLAVLSGYLALKYIQSQLLCIITQPVLFTSFTDTASTNNFPIRINITDPKAMPPLQELTQTAHYRPFITKSQIAHWNYQSLKIQTTNGYATIIRTQANTYLCLHNYTWKISNSTFDVFIRQLRQKVAVKKTIGNIKLQTNFTFTAYKISSPHTFPHANLINTTQYTNIAGFYSVTVNSWYLTYTLYPTHMYDGDVAWQQQFPWDTTNDLKSLSLDIATYVDSNSQQN